MNKYIGWRGSGKTSCIVRDAVKDAQNGTRTLIVAPSMQSARYIGEKIDEVTHGEFPVKLQVTSASTALDLNLDNFDAVYIDELSACLKAAHVRGFSDTNYE